MPHVITVQQIKLPVFACSHQEVRVDCTADRIRQDHSASGTEVIIAGIHAGLVIRSEVIRNAQIQSLDELNHAIAKRLRVWRSIESTISGDAVNRAIRRGSKASS